MNDPLNRLREYMRLYDEMGMGPRPAQRSSQGWESPVQFDRAGMRADWARQMMDQDGLDGPDFFAESMPERPPMRQQPQQPLQSRNQLLMMLRGFNGRP